jgi:hypothetical protein
MPISGRQVSHLLLFKKTDIEISGRIEKENERATHTHTHTQIHSERESACVCAW